MQLTSIIAVAAAATLFSAAGASAGPVLEQTNMRLEAIAAGNTEAVNAQYGEGMRLEWVGGPLDGTYSTAEEISGVWSKFSKAQGQQTVEIGNAVEGASPAGATVAVMATFKGKATVPVLYVATYRKEKLVTETWQVNPPAN